jgi:hypothetical protein
MELVQQGYLTCASEYREAARQQSVVAERRGQ